MLKKKKNLKITQSSVWGEKGNKTVYFSKCTLSSFRPTVYSWEVNVHCKIFFFKKKLRRNKAFSDKLSILEPLWRCRLSEWWHKSSAMCCTKVKKIWEYSLFMSIDGDEGICFFLSLLLTDGPTHSPTFLMWHANNSAIMISPCSCFVLQPNLWTPRCHIRHPVDGRDHSEGFVQVGPRSSAHTETWRPNHATAPGASSAPMLCAAHSQCAENVKLTTKLSVCVALW